MFQTSPKRVSVVALFVGLLLSVAMPAGWSARAAGQVAVGSASTPVTSPLLATLRDPQAGSGDNFGASVAIAGDTAVVGEANYQNPAQVYVYSKGGSTWPHVPTTTLGDPNPTPHDAFGQAVAISGNTLIVGDYQNNTTTGNAYIYMQTSAGWPSSPTVTLADPRATTGDAFGSSVAASGDTILVGSYGAGGSFPGAAYIYSRTGSGWSATPTTTLPNPGPKGDLYGSSVALSDRTAVVGACGCGGGGYPGFAYIYSRSQSGWPSKPTVALNDPVDRGGDTFGISVAVSGMSAIVGATGTRSSTGAAYVYRETGQGWGARPTATLSDPGATQGDYFGTVSMAGSSAAITAFKKMYVYRETAQGWGVEPAEIRTDPGGKHGFFGASVALSGSTAAVGAPGTTNNTGITYLYGV